MYRDAGKCRLFSDRFPNAGSIGRRNGFPPLWLMLFASSVSPEHACAAAEGSRP